MFRIEIAGQMAAWLLCRHGGSMPHLKLMKLLYLTERTCIERYGFPALGDYLVSMPHGPVLSVTLDYMRGAGSPDNGWSKWVSLIQNHTVSLAREYKPEELDLLSEVDVEVLQEVWDRFGNMEEWDIRDYTHNHCPEWKDPQGSSLPITYKYLLDILGYGEKSAEMAAELEAQRQIRTALLS